MKIIVFTSLLISSILYSCQSARPITNYVNQTQSSDYKKQLTGNIDSLWQKLLYYAYQNKFNIRSQFKSNTDASIRVEIVDARLTTLDKKTKALKDTGALALAEVEKRYSNYNYLYPKTGNLEYIITINKRTDNECLLTVSMEKICNATSYYEEGYIKKRPIPNVAVTSTGALENQIIMLFN